MFNNERFLFKNISIRTLSGSSLFLLLSQINPAVLKSLSEKTVAGGMHK